MLGSSTRKLRRRIMHEATPGPRFSLPVHCSFQVNAGQRRSTQVQPSSAHWRLLTSPATRAPPERMYHLQRCGVDADPGSAGTPGKGTLPGKGEECNKARGQYCRRKTNQELSGLKGADTYTRRGPRENQDDSQMTASRIQARGSTCGIAFGHSLLFKLVQGGHEA